VVSPRAGAVRDVIGPAFPAVLGSLGARPTAPVHVADTFTATAAAFAASTSDMLVVTGGTSRGRTDHARAAAADAGIDLLVDGVAMRPGHPVALGRRPDGRPVALLPGNPFAAFACLISFAGPILAGMSGREPAPFGLVRCGAPIRTDARHTRLVAVRVDAGLAYELRHQGSGMLRGLSDADALAIVEPGSGGEGDAALTLRLPW